MKRTKVIGALLILILITASSYTLAKFYDQRIYVIRAQHSKPKVLPAIAEAENIEETPESTESMPESEPELSESEVPADSALLSPQLVFESEASTSEPEELPLQEEGIYAVQLYGGAAEAGTSNYLVGYLTYTGDKKLSYQLETVEPIEESKEIMETDSAAEQPKVSKLFQAEITKPIMQVEAINALSDKTVLTEIPEDSKLRLLLSPKEERTTSKIIVTYLGPISEAAQIEKLNQTN